MNSAAPKLDVRQLRLLKVIFAQGAEDASRTLSKWLRHGIRLSIDEVEQIPLARATQVLGSGEDIVTACLMGLHGRLTGTLILAFEDESGLALADMLIGNPLGASTQWGELEQSAAMETANILGCAYLNSLMAHLPESADHSKLIPSPPQFVQDFAGSLLETAMMGQAMVTDELLLIRTQFSRDQTRLSWHLLLIPDAASLSEIARVLGS